MDAVGHSAKSFPALQLKLRPHAFLVTAKLAVEVIVCYEQKCTRQDLPKDMLDELMTLSELLGISQLTQGSKEILAEQAVSDKMDLITKLAGKELTTIDDVRNLKQAHMQSRNMDRSAIIDELCTSRLLGVRRPFA